MDNLGFIKVRAFVPEVKIGDTEHNALQIIKAVESAAKERVNCIVFPELCISGYTCGDLFLQDLLMKKAEEGVRKIADATQGLDILVAVGAPVMALGQRYNCAVLIYQGNIIGIVPKSFLPNYGEFYEKRWFTSGLKLKNHDISYAGNLTHIGSKLLFEYNQILIGVEICEDLWVPTPPSSLMAMAGAEIILNLSASDSLIGKHDYLVSLISQQSARCRCVYVYASAGWGESSTDLVFSGKAIIAEDGTVYGKENKFPVNQFYETRDVDIQKIRLDRARFNTFFSEEEIIPDYDKIKVCNQSNRPFKEDSRDETESVYGATDSVSIEVDPHPFVPDNPDQLNQRCEEIINIQSYGLMKRLAAIGCRKAVVGISGGLDSTLALLVTVNAFDKLNIPRSNIIGVTMPGLATTSRTKNNATLLMENLGVSSREIPIGEAVAVHFKDIGQDPEIFDATYENSQARERTQLLMDLANKEGGIVIGTGDMSELALGWCTYNGDQMSMYGVNASVPKTLVKHLVSWFASFSNTKVANILKDIIDTPISPELVPSKEDEISQKTEDLVGPYELHDFFLYHFLRNSFEPVKIFRLAEMAFKEKYSSETILKWLKVFIRRFFSQQFKRSCMPDGPKVGSVNLSPRGDWRMPSDASPALWLSQLDSIQL